jgi:hypothetical protein
MIIHQILGFPITILIILVGAALAKLLDVANNPFWWWLVIPILFSSLLWFAAASAYGIYVGARIVWQITGGVTLRAALKQYFTTTLLAGLLRNS